MCKKNNIKNRAIDRYKNEKKNYLINTHKTNSLNIYYSSKSNKLYYFIVS